MCERMIQHNTTLLDIHASMSAQQKRHQVVEAVVVVVVVCLAAAYELKRTRRMTSIREE